MPEDWTAEVVGRMHKARIKGLQLAARAGISNAYLSTVLNGHKGTEGTKAKILSALESLEAEAAQAEVSAGAEGGQALLSGQRGGGGNILGCVLCLARGAWDGQRCPTLHVKAVVVDGEVIRANAWYTPRRGGPPEPEA